MGFHNISQLYRIYFKKGQNTMRHNNARVYGRKHTVGFKIFFISTHEQSFQSVPDIAFLHVKSEIE